jgi:acetyl-CoA synthetase
MIRAQYGRWPVGENTMPNVYPVPAEFARDARFDADRYAAEYERSVRDPESFWGEVGKRLDWLVPYSRSGRLVRREGLPDPLVRGRPAERRANCLDRHLATRGDKTAILWEGDDPNESRRVTYRELHEQVCRFANVLKEPRREARATASRSTCR